MSMCFSASLFQITQVQPVQSHASGRFLSKGHRRGLQTNSVSQFVLQLSNSDIRASRIISKNDVLIVYFTKRLLTSSKQRNCKDYRLIYSVTCQPKKYHSVSHRMKFFVKTSLCNSQKTTKSPIKADAEQFCNLLDYIQQLYIFWH